jgi:hypothetical protein
MTNPDCQLVASRYTDCAMAACQFTAYTVTIKISIRAQQPETGYVADWISSMLKVTVGINIELY